LVASLAVSQTIRSYGLCSLIKWPNDVRVHKKKIAGILLESEIITNKISYVVLGIGINLNTEIHQYSPQLQKSITSLYHELGKAVDYCTFFKDILLTFDKYYSLFQNNNYERIISEWKQLSDTVGQRVKILTSSAEIVGKASDIDSSGFLLVSTDTGELKRIMSGDCLHFSEL